MYSRNDTKNPDAEKYNLVNNIHSYSILNTRPYCRWDVVVFDCK